MPWNAAWYLSSGYGRNDPRGPNRVYIYIYIRGRMRNCNGATMPVAAGSTRKHGGKGCRNLFFKELGTDSFRVHWVIPIVYARPIVLSFSLLDLSLIYWNDRNEDSVEIWLFFFSFEMAIFFLNCEHLRFCRNAWVEGIESLFFWEKIFRKK